MLLRGRGCWVLAAVLLYLAIGNVKGAIRCYCNREECKKEYTCISYVEKCYSKLFTVYAHENKTAVLKQPSKDEHGCVDLVSSQKRGSTLCDGQGDVVKQLKELEPLIMCCSDRMCNYRKSQDIHVDIVDPETIRQEPAAVVENGEEMVQENKTKMPQTSEDVIFRAAVIAVPIAGGLILVILILMAVRMLREDYRRSDRQNGLLKAHSFIEQHFVRKDQKKEYKHKKSHIKNGGNYRPVSIHQQNIGTSPKPWSDNECLAKQESEATHRTSEHTKSHNICVSLLTADKQSELSLV